MKKFVTEVEIVDDSGSEVVEVVTELPSNVAAKAEEIYRLHGGHMSHNEIVAAAGAFNSADVSAWRPTPSRRGDVGCVVRTFR